MSRRVPQSIDYMNFNSAKFCETLRDILFFYFLVSSDKGGGYLIVLLLNSEQRMAVATEAFKDSAWDASSFAVEKEGI